MYTINTVSDIDTLFNQKKNGQPSRHITFDQLEI